MDLIEEYRLHLVRSNVSAETVKSYVGVVRALSAWSGKPAHELTADDAAAFLRRPGLSQSSRHTYHRWLCAWDRWSSRGTVAGVRRARPPRRRPKPAAVAQIAAMLQACECEQDTALVLLTYTAGLRRAEAACFRGDQLDAFERRVHVHGGKGGVDADVPAVPALLAHAARMPARGFWFPSPVHPGRPVGPHTVWSRLTRISERAGVGHVPPHRLRHAYATQMIAAGAPLTTVRMCMRHASMASTAMYVGVTAEEELDAASRIPLAGADGEDPSDAQ